MTARLVFLSGSRAGTAIDLPEGDVTIGRNPRSMVAFDPSDVIVSADHATLLYRDGRHFLRDEASRNGTFVNGERIVERELASGDLLQFGAGGPGARFVYAVHPDMAPTLDPRELARASELLELTKRRSDVGESTRASALTSTRELVAMVVRRGKRTRRYLFGTAAVSLVAILSLVIWQRQSRVAFQRTLEELSVALAGERASRSMLEENLAGLQLQADSLRRTLDGERARVAADPNIDSEAVLELSRSVALLVFTYGFADSDGRRLLRYAVNDQGQPVFNTGPDGVPVPGITFGGSGPPLQQQGTATGFLIDSSGYLLTNRHVAAPWEQDEELEFMRARGLDVVGQFIDLRAFFPPGNRVYPLVVERVSEQADLALLRVMGSAVSSPPLPLAPPRNAARPGDQLVLIGYPTGVHNLMFRVNQETRGAILADAGQNARGLAEALAQRRLIQPLIMRGNIADTTGTEVIHNVLSTVGGSGGPLLDLSRHVVAVHYASVRSPRPGDPFQTQRGVPIRFAWDILPPTLRAALAQEP